MRVTNQMMSTTYLKDLNKNLNNLIPQDLVKRDDLIDE